MVKLDAPFGALHVATFTPIAGHKSKAFRCCRNLAIQVADNRPARGLRFRPGH